MAQIKCQIYLQPMISNSCPRARHARAHPGQAGKRHIAKIRRAQPRHTTGSGGRGEHITTRQGDADVNLMRWRGLRRRRRRDRQRQLTHP